MHELPLLSCLLYSKACQVVSEVDTEQGHHQSIATVGNGALSLIPD